MEIPMKIKTYEPWQLREEVRPAHIFCAECGKEVDTLVKAWGMDMQTNKEVAYPVSWCCHSDLCSHRTSVELRLTKVGKRMVKEKVNRQLIDTLIDIANPYRKERMA